MTVSIVQRFKTAYAVNRLTRRYFRSNQVPNDCQYYINGSKVNISGQHALVMLMGIVLNDCYGLKRFKRLNNIVDIGANIGIFSIHAATLFTQAKVYAYEPCQDALSDLERNVKELNVEVYPYAVGLTNQKVYMNIEEDLTACSITVKENNLLKKSQKCDMIAFGEIVEQLGGCIGLLKLDCEGSEYEIIESPAFKYVKYVVGELHTCHSGNPEQGLNQLARQGFIVDRWVLFPDGKAGEFWASNSRNTDREKSWLV